MNNELSLFLRQDGLSGWWTDIAKLTHNVMLLILHVLLQFPTLLRSQQSFGPGLTLLCLYFMIQHGPCGIYRQALCGWRYHRSVAALLPCTYTEVWHEPVWCHFLQSSTSQWLVHSCGAVYKASNKSDYDIIYTWCKSHDRSSQLIK